MVSCDCIIDSSHKNDYNNFDTDLGVCILNNELVRVLGMLYDMEMNNYYMARGIEKLNEEIQKLAIKKTFAIPQKRYMRSTTGEGLTVCLIVSIIIAFAVFFIYEDNSGKFLLALFFGALSAIPSFLISYLFYYLTTKSSDDRQTEFIYEKEFEEYNNNIRLDKLRVEKEIAEKNFLINQRDALIKRKAEATEKLNEFYSKLNIAEEFRNLLPLGYMYEFARLGISDKLTGIDGLYYLVHKELRADRFQLSLNEISRRLDSIIDNQRSISAELRALNDKCDNIIEQTKKKAEISAKSNDLLEQAVKNTEISKYNSERIKKELEYQTFIDLWDIKGSNFF